jgi:hypothetical protein
MISKPFLPLSYILYLQKVGENNGIEDPGALAACGLVLTQNKVSKAEF